VDRNRCLGIIRRAAVVAALLAIVLPAPGTAAAAKSPPSLRETSAEATVRDAIERRLGGSSLIFNQLDCSKASRGVYSCRAAFFVGDALWKGTGSVRRRKSGDSNRYVFHLSQAKRLCRGISCKPAVRWCSPESC
jgi:hypothetical protein